MKRKDIKQVLKTYFLNNPTVKLRVREIERTLNLPLPSVIRYCRELEKEDILTKEKIGAVVFFKADRTNGNYLLEKKLHNLRQIYTSGVVGYLKKELSNPPIVLFGSFARGEDIEQSDIDLYIETPSRKEVHLEKFEKKLKRRIQVFIGKGLNTLKNPHLANNIVNGVTINNYVEVFR